MSGLSDDANKTRGSKVELSKQARSLWAKTDAEDGSVWLPLYIHATDTALTMVRLWDEWIPKSVKNLFSRHCCGSEELARKSLIFLASAHDIGKATPIFQAKPCGRGWNGEMESLAWKPMKAGLPIKANLSAERHPTHPIAGQVLVNLYLQESCGWSSERADAWGSIVGAHHGNVPSRERVHEAFVAASKMGFAANESDGAWRDVQHELLDHARRLAGMADGDISLLGKCVWDAPAESVASGLLIMADWIASNQDLFPLVPLIPGASSPYEMVADPDGRSLDDRADRAWQVLDLSPSWVGKCPAVSDEWFCERFALPQGAVPRPVQRAAMEAAARMTEPSLMVIEAPMGEGKTEAALAAAEVVGSKFGCGGVCVALPTMATTDAMFGRVHRWLDGLAAQPPSSIFLAHGKSRLNEEYQGIVRSSRMHHALSSMGADLDDGAAERDERVVVSDWMQGRKKGMLANFVVCTVDQVLMGALDMKHLSLRHLALASKVVVIDECHAYDSYMQQYLKRVLEWLGAWGCPVILLSATLPTSVRGSLVAAYREGRSSQKVRPAATLDGASELVAPCRTGRSRKERARAGRGNSESVAIDALYPLVTVASESEVGRVECPTSSREARVNLSVMSDDLDALVAFLRDELNEGGVTGVVCDTVARAQATYRALSASFGSGEVVLTHARFIDLDRMENESSLRASLGPNATRHNGKRPERMIVVGTQVLEQSLDIDFDLLVTDLAPIDLLMQRLGRVHRHVRGTDEEDRPIRLRCARCLIRGVKDIAADGPLFASGVARVYDGASLMEALAVSGLISMGAQSALSLPQDIAKMVRTAYSPLVKERMPAGWSASYDAACCEREKTVQQKEKRAEAFLLPSASGLVRDEKSLLNLFARTIEDASASRMNEDIGQRAVRDTQETVEVLLVRRKGENICLLPWVGSERDGVEWGQEIPTAYGPDWVLAMLVAQCAVRLPLALCRPQDLDRLIAELESGCERWVAAWQDVSVLTGRLVLVLEEADGEPEVYEAKVLDQRVRYTREEGLSTVHQ